MSVATDAYGWRLERSDGVTLGFTSHDRDVLFEDVLLRASPGMMPGVIVESLGLDSDGLDVKGALTSDAISPEDLNAGRWDGARLEIFLFDWERPELEKRILATGELGAISVSGDAFEAEFLGLTKQLDRPVVPLTSPGCRAQFCDAACGLNRQRFARLAHVSLIDGTAITVSAPLPNDLLAYGRLRWLEGANCGLESDIVANEGDGLTLIREPAFPAAPGTRVEIMEGCDKRFETCVSRFGNAVNFRGEPHLPGNDLLTRFPGG